MHHDFLPYYVRVGDTWTKIDYSRKPASWHLHDSPPMMFIKRSPNNHGFVSPYVIEKMWRDHFDWVYREYKYAVFPMTIHPDVSGHPHVLMMFGAALPSHRSSSRRPLLHNE